MAPALAEQTAVQDALVRAQGIVGLALQRVPAARRVRGFLDVPAAVTPRSI